MTLARGSATGREVRPVFARYSAPRLPGAATLHATPAEQRLFRWTRNRNYDRAYAPTADPGILCYDPITPIQELPMTIDGSCHCGAVSLALGDLPNRIVECGCSICSRLGVRWAYFAPDQVQVTGSTDTYVCNNRVIAFHRCKNCGCVSHWATLGTDFGRMGVNTRLLEGVDLTGIEVRVLAGPGPEAFD